MVTSLVCSPISAWGERAGGDTDPIGVAAGEQGGSRRAACALSYIETCKDHSLGSHTIEVWSFKSFCTEGSDIGISKIVCKDNHKIWQAGLFLRRDAGSVRTAYEGKNPRKYCQRFEKVWAAHCVSLGCHKCLLLSRAWI